MKLNMSRELIVQIIIVAIVIFFGFSMLTPLMSGENNNQNNNQVPPEEEYEVFMAQGNVGLTLKEYSGVIEVDKITNDSREYVMEGVNDGDVLYFNEEIDKVSIVLSDKTKTYEYAKKLIESDSNITIILNARVYSDEEFDFTTDDGKIVSSKVPESEIRVSYPYEIGDILYYRALVQFYNDDIVGAQLYPLPTVEEMEMLFMVDEVSNEYYYRAFFNWSDRQFVRDFSNNLNATLTGEGAENVVVNFVSDVTIYANRPVYSEEADLLKERFENIKTINMEKIVFYDNSTETEEEISDYVYNITNGTLTLEFSPALLEFTYEFDGEYSEIESVFETVNNRSIKLYHGKKAFVSTGSTTAIKGDSTYNVDAIEKMVLIPVSKEKGDLVSLFVDATIEANTISEVEQILDLNFQ
jgi:hypothetical protein